MSRISDTGLLRLTPTGLDRFQTDALPDWASWSADGLTLTADASGRRQVFVFCSPQVLVAGLSAADVLQEAARTEALSLSSDGISHMLQTGFVPMTDTVFSELRRLGMGDSLLVAPRGGGLSFEGSEDYPWLTSNSREDERPDTQRLADLIGASLERGLAAVDGRAVLMMSSGKDSGGLAIALAEGGYDVPCFTYKHKADDPEPEFARRFCDQLGLRHRTIELPRDQATTAQNLRRFFAGAVFPCVDHALVPVVTLAAASGLDAGALIDGGGNDTYMTYIPGRTRRMKERLRLRWRPAAAAAKRIIRVDSPINYLARSEASIFFPGRNPRHREVRRFYPDAIDTTGFWYELAAATRGMDPLDAIALRLVRHTEGSRSNDKARMVAAAYGLTPLFPYMDDDLSGYYFNLPVAERYDLGTGRSKLLLRQLLDERLAYSASGVGDGHFSFDGAAFVRDNEQLVRDEIFSCSLWEPSVEPLVDEWLLKLRRRPFLFHSLLPLFLVSGWHNHSRYVRSAR